MDQDGVEIKERRKRDHRGDLQSFSGITAEPVPEPSTMLLLGADLLGLAGFGRKKFFKK